MAAREDTTTFASAVDTLFIDRWLAILKTRIVIVPMATQSRMSDNQGLDVQWVLLDQPVSDPLAIANEGDDPTDTHATDSLATGTMVEFGGVTPFSKVLIRSAISGTLEQMIDFLGHAGARTMDDVTADAADASGTAVDAGTAMTVDALRQGAQTLVNNGALPLNITPGGRYYGFAGSTEACYDMIGEGTPTFMQTKNNDVESAFMLPLQDTPTTAGVYGCLIKICQNIRRNDTPTPEDDLNLLVAQDGIGTASIDTNTLQPSVTVTMPQDLVSAPARNRGTIAWWALFVAVLLDANRVVVISSDATGT